jgi:hypothetical protein
VSLRAYKYQKVDYFGKGEGHKLTLCHHIAILLTLVLTELQDAFVFTAK